MCYICVFASAARTLRRTGVSFPHSPVAVKGHEESGKHDHTQVQYVYATYLELNVSIKD